MNECGIDECLLEGKAGEWVRAAVNVCVQTTPYDDQHDGGDDEGDEYDEEMGVCRRWRQSRHPPELKGVYKGELLD